MACHSSVPYAKYPYGIFNQHGRPVEEHIPEAPSNQNAEQSCIKNKIADFILLERSVSMAGKPFHQIKGCKKACDVGDPIPAYAKLLIELNQERTEMMDVEGEEHWMNKIEGSKIAREQLDS